MGGEEACQERAPGAFRAKIVSKRERDMRDQRAFISLRMLREGRGGPGEARCASASSSSNPSHVGVTVDKKRDR